MEIEQLIEQVEKLIDEEGIESLREILPDRDECETDADYLYELLDALQKEWTWFSFVTKELIRLSTLAGEMKEKAEAEASGGS